LLKPTPSPSTANATPAMTDDTILAFSFPAVHAEKIAAAFDGGCRYTISGTITLSDHMYMSPRIHASGLERDRLNLTSRLSGFDDRQRGGRFDPLHGEA
jgi:hypothetical protein